MTLPHRAAGALLLAGALVASGCGTSCPTETPAKIEAIGSCTAKPGDTVSVPVRLCPTCNQSGATCQVDTHAAGSSGLIQLDPTVEACENVSTCSSPTPQCQTNPLTCTFTAPAAGNYTLLVLDQSSNQTIQGTLVVDPGQTPSCAFSTALRVQ